MTQPVPDSCCWFDVAASPCALGRGAAASAALAQDDDPDRDPNDAQPDFYVATLPTNLRLPKDKMAFRLTHRFLRTLGDGDFGDLRQRFFGFDSGAQIGLELRYGARSAAAQIGIYRTSDRTIQFYGQYNLDQQDGNGPIGVGLVVNVDGTDNFSDSSRPAWRSCCRASSATAARSTSSRRSSATPTCIQRPVDDDYTVMVRRRRARARRAATPTCSSKARRASRATSRASRSISFGIEQRAGGHMFQLNFSNGFGTTLAQVARGGTAHDDWYIGFNLSRKFF